MTDPFALPGPPLDLDGIEVISAGFAIARGRGADEGYCLPPPRGERRIPENAAIEVLLMRHVDRWDLPKGHVDPGESIPQAAVRELQEETGIRLDQIWVDPHFRFELRHQVTERGRAANKLLVIFLAWLKCPVQLQLTEHPDHRWFAWQPPHSIQARVIDPLLAEIHRHWSVNTLGANDGQRS